MAVESDGEGVAVADEHGMRGGGGHLHSSVGDRFPPKWDDGNYAILADGKDDPKKVGVDGILGTAPVCSCKPNALGFYDPGGNMTEWVLDGFDVKARKSNRVLRGGDWFSYANFARSALRINRTATTANFSNSFRPARARLQSSEAGSR